MLGIEYHITFQLFLNSADYGDIIHFTLGGNKGVYGDRTPRLWIFNKTLWLASAIDGDKNYVFRPPLPSLNTWHSIEISQLSEGSEVFQKYISLLLI